MCNDGTVELPPSAVAVAVVLVLVGSKPRLISVGGTGRRYFVMWRGGAAERDT
jgi:hypothetical protein